MKIVIDDIVIPISTEAKNLGVVFSTDMRFREHVTRSIQSAYAAIKAIYPSRHCLSQSIKTRLCDSLVLSRFNFGDVVYGPCLTARDRARIQRIQNACMRLIFSIRKYDRISHKLQDLGWLNVQNRRTLHAYVIFHKLLITGTPPYLLDKITFRTDVHTLNLRFRGLLTPPAHKTELFKRSFSYQIYKLYNDLPDDVKQLLPGAFRRAIVKMLYNRQIGSQT